MRKADSLRPPRRTGISTSWWRKLSRDRSEAISTWRWIPWRSSRPASGSSSRSCLRRRRTRPRTRIGRPPIGQCHRRGDLEVSVTAGQGHRRVQMPRVPHGAQPTASLNHISGLCPKGRARVALFNIVLAVLQYSSASRDQKKGGRAWACVQAQALGVCVFFFRAVAAE